MRRHPAALTRTSRERVEVGRDPHRRSVPRDALDLEADSVATALEHARHPQPDRVSCFLPEIPLQNDGPCRARTYDLGIKSPLLYQLS